MKGNLFLGLIVAVCFVLPTQSVQAFDPGAWFAQKVGELDQKIAANKVHKNFSAGQAGARTGDKKRSGTFRHIKKYLKSETEKNKKLKR